MRRITQAGKFEGCLLIDLFAYELILQGEGEFLSDGDGGVSYTRIDGPFSGKSFGPLNYREQGFLGRQAGCILKESSQGFVSVQWYENAQELANQWDELEKDFSEESEIA